mmetsp:Transcript_18128/g.44491  ORF Transcript_18128/g.44491 Transcript_18128/m.44491 type:complete len:311 (-) Transcript_18128:687-1619(-)
MKSRRWKMICSTIRSFCSKASSIPADSLAASTCLILSYSTASCCTCCFRPFRRASNAVLRETMDARVDSAFSRSPEMLEKVLSSSSIVFLLSFSDSSSRLIFESRLLIFSSSWSRISFSCARRSAVLWEFSRLRCLYATSLCRSWKPSLVGTWLPRDSCLLMCSISATTLRCVSFTAADSRFSDSGNFSMNSVISWSFSCSFWYFFTSSDSAPPPDSRASSSFCACAMRFSVSSMLRCVIAMCWLSSLTCCSSCSLCSASLSTGWFRAASSVRLRSRSCCRCSCSALMRCLLGSDCSVCSFLATCLHRLS